MNDWGWMYTQACPPRRQLARSCHSPTNPNTTHTLSSLYLLPPSGTYRYLTSQRLYDACQPFQKPRMVALLLTHRSTA